MFKTIDEARAALDEALPPDVAARVAAALIPAIVLTPKEGDALLGGTRLGGTPDLPPELNWPRPEPPADPETIAGRGNADAGAAMRAHFALNPPFAFVAQIDLAEAVALGPVAAALPAEGRLLFFYDYAVGPWESGTRTARVVWDRAPRETLRTSPVPADLVEAISRERDARKMAFAEHGLDAPDDGGVYAAPGHGAALGHVLRLPNPHSLEIAGLPEIIAAKPFYAMSEAEQKAYATYRDFLNEYDSFDQDRSRRQQLLGSPMPEQDDPRLDAVVFTEFGKPHLSREEWELHGAAVEAAAKAWILLLQIDLGDWTQQDLVEGTIYFLIRAEDLAQRRFETVVGVYQQT